MKDWFKNPKNDYQVYSLPEAFAFAFCGFFMSGLFVVILPVDHWISFSIGYSITYLVAMKIKHEKINEDLQVYFEFKNKKK